MVVKAILSITRQDAKFSKDTEERRDKKCGGLEACVGAVEAQFQQLATAVKQLEQVLDDQWLLGAFLKLKGELVVDDVGPCALRPSWRILLVALVYSTLTTGLVLCRRSLFTTIAGGKGPQPHAG